VPKLYWKYVGNTTAALWAAVVSFFSLQPSEDLPRVFLSVTDLVLHAGAYAGLSFALAIGRAESNVWSWRRMIAAFAVGTSLEVLQPLVSGRFFDFRDVVSNASGIFLGTVLASFLTRRIFNP
jgi:glycopeptide antibiotics resistance protein